MVLPLQCNYLRTVEAFHRGVCATINALMLGEFLAGKKMMILLGSIIRRGGRSRRKLARLSKNFLVTF